MSHGAAARAASLGKNWLRFFAPRVNHRNASGGLSPCYAHAASLPISRVTSPINLTILEYESCIRTSLGIISQHYTHIGVGGFFGHTSCIHSQALRTPATEKGGDGKRCLRWHWLMPWDEGMKKAMHTGLPICVGRSLTLRRAW